MRSLIHLALAIPFAILLVACGKATPSPADQTINPGDTVGDFLITTGEGDDVVFVTQLHCPLEGTTETCEQPVGRMVNVSQGFFAEPGGTPLDQQWSEQTYEMTIEGRPVNLQAFGYEEFDHPVVGTVRVWNVVIAADCPGTIAAHSSGVLRGESWTYTAVIAFTAP